MLRLRLSAVAILALVLSVNVALWAYVNQPIETRPWSGLIRGVSFAPYQKDHDPQTKRFPTVEDIDADLRFVQDKVNAVRTYSTLNGIAETARLARRYGLSVTAGAWIGDKKDENEAELRGLIRMANENWNVNRVVVGNEAILRADVTVAEAIDYIKRVKAEVKVPVSTAEPWHVWLKHPELVEASDYIAVHVLPYWEGIHVDRAVDYVLMRLGQLEATYPGKKVVLSEVGWPSYGRIRNEAVASLANQAIFVRQFLNVARQWNIDYFVMEAFDQPWKRWVEGGVGAFWGIWDADRKAKFPLTGEIVPQPDWPWYAGAATLLALVPLVFFLGRERGLNGGGRLFYAGVVQVVATSVVLAAMVFSLEYFTVSKALVWGFLVSALLFVLAILLTEAYEIAEALWKPRLDRFHPPLTPPADARLPKVSIHVPICNEPPEMVMQTLDALARLDYPDFEVLVIDNNTADDSLWPPVQAYCERLGERFRFFHVKKIAGYKAGALNFALRHTAPDAEVVAVIDSDYIVERDWLKSSTPYFANPKVGFVQGPQDYRDAGESVFKTMAYWEYIAFFHVGMKLRNERNAIIQHGTMTMIRKEALERSGRWAEWCITEDAELGLRLFADGYEAVYIHHSFGRGLIPDSFDAFKRQRARWAYGAMRILKAHWRELLPRWIRPASTRLTAGQKYHFISGWAPWIADGLNLVFTAGGLLLTIGALIWPKSVELPVALFLMATLGFFTFKTIGNAVVYGARISASPLQILGSSIAGLALVYTVAKAVIYGAISDKRPFMRTPKCENQPAFVRGLAQSWEECLWLVAILGLSLTMGLTRGQAEPETMLWAVVLGINAVPHAAAVITSMINVLPALRLKPVAEPALETQRG